MRHFWRGVVCIMLCIAHGGLQATSLPKVASMNLCTDRLLIDLADPMQLESLSHVSTNPNSVMRVAPSNSVINRGRIEEIVRLDANDIFTFEFENPKKVNRLRHYGKNVILFSQPKTLDELRSNILRMGEAINRQSQARKALMQFNQALENGASALENLSENRVLMIGANGFVSGTDSLSGQLVSALGLYNVAQDINLQDSAQVPIEKIIDLEPDIVLLSVFSDDFSFAQNFIYHPALEKVWLDKQIIRIPSREWMCSDLGLIAVMKRLINETRAQ